MTYMLPALISLILVSTFHIPGFLDASLAEITMRELLSEMLCLVSAFVCLAFLSRSIERDPIWPWYRRPATKH